VSRVEQSIRDLAPRGLQITIWPRKGGGFQANVKETSLDGWVCETRDDPVHALAEALRQRGCVGARDVSPPPDAEEQIDIEEAIMAATVKAGLEEKEWDGAYTDDMEALLVDDDDFEGLL